MVLATSDSCDTLVSLGNGLKEVNTQGVNGSDTFSDNYEATELYLPRDDFDENDGENFGNFEQRMYLPATQPVDQYLRHLPQLMEGCDELLANSPRHFDQSSREHLLYVAQGEVGHSLSSQCDVIVSDRATTCHILALRSESSANVPLSSLTHLDCTSYEKCVRKMFGEHLSHHGTSDSEKIQLSIHLVGGFEDEKESSREISNWLMRLLSAIAFEHKNSMAITLQTCAISSMNDNGFSSPIGRGLGLDTRTGRVFLASVDSSVAGPCVVLRSARLWSQCKEPRLSLVHSQKSTQFEIGTFTFTSCPELKQLLRLPDELLLKYTSTSPDVEEADFCSSVRSTLKFLRDVKCTQVFGPHVDQPLIFKRTSSNSWSRSF